MNHKLPQCSTTLIAKMSQKNRTCNILSIVMLHVRVFCNFWPFCNSLFSAGFDLHLTQWMYAYCSMQNQCGIITDHLHSWNIREFSQYLDFLFQILTLYRTVFNYKNTLHNISNLLSKFLNNKISLKSEKVTMRQKFWNKKLRKSLWYPQTEDVY